MRLLRLDARTPGKGSRESLALCLLLASLATAYLAFGQTPPHRQPEPPHRQPEVEAPLLVPGEALGHRLQAQETHVYRVESRLDLRLVVEQRDIDVEVTVETELGERFTADSPFDRRGREAVLLSGRPSYLVAVRGREPGAPPGGYVLELEPVADLSPARRLVLDAARAGTAAARLYHDGTREAWRQAVVHQGQALLHWRALGETGEAARALYARAVLHRLVEVPHRALEDSRQVVELARRLGDRELEGYAGNELGLDHWHLGDAEEARRAFHGAAVLAEATGDRYLVAAAKSNLCLMDLSQGELELARGCYEGALDAIREASSGQIESAARTNLGRIAEHLGEPEEALDHYRRALRVLAASGDRRGEAQTLNNLGVLLRGLGELDAAMARYAEASEIFAELGEPRWQARVLSNVGYAYRSLGEPRRALASFERACELFRRLEDRRGEAATLDNLGLVHSDLGQAGSALGFHRRALELRRGDGDRRGEAVTLRRLGDVHAELGERDRALDHLQRAVRLSGELGNRPNEAAARLGLGRIYLEAGQRGSAHEELSRALDLATGAGQWTTESEALYHLARLDHETGRTGGARRRISEALERLEGLRARIDSPDLRTSYSRLLRRVLELDVQVLMSAHRRDPAAGRHREALEVAERARARTLLDLLQEADVDLASGVDGDLLRRRHRLARRLDAKTERLADPSLDAATHRALTEEQLGILQRLDVLDAEIRRASPAYGEIVRPLALTAEEIQALVDPGTVLAYYFLGEPRSYLWRVTPAAIDVFELSGQAQIEAAARRVHALWSQRDPAHRSQDYAAARELAQRLRLQELSGFHRVAVLADGSLHVIPFAALPVADGDAGGPAPPLLVRSEVVFLPSASVLALSRRLHDARGPASSVALVADPVFGPGYPALPGARREARAIAAAAPAATLTAFGFDADRELVEGGRLRGYDVVHFATHGVIDTENPALSGLALSQVDREGRPRPGFLHLHDIFNLRLDAELVVLSGCRTGLGPVVRGEGLIGLVRGFMYAGSRRVVASLWQVEDQATAALMTRFYHGLWQEAVPPSSALAAAQRELAGNRRFRDPYYWAGFVLVGDWR